MTRVQLESRQQLLRQRITETVGRIAELRQALASAKTGLAQMQGALAIVDESLVGEPGNGELEATDAG